MVHSIDPGLMINNVAGLAQAAKNLGVPTILSTVGAKGSILAQAPERAAVGDIWSRRGSGVGLLIDYVFAQVTAGLVPMPSFMSAPDKARFSPGTDRRADETAATDSGQRI
jgi:hypothetical protein